MRNSGRPAILLLVCLWITPQVFSQHKHESHPTTSSPEVEAQPFLAQVMRLNTALSFLGSALPSSEASALQSLSHQPLNKKTTDRIQEILDPFCLAFVTINPESRVKVTRGPAAAKLIQGGWVSYLVKVVNEAGITAHLQAESPNAATPLYAPTYNPSVDESKKLSAGQVANRFLEIQVYRNPPMTDKLSGLRVEYVILQLFCKDKGQREAEIGFNAGQGTQDIGFRNTINILFNSAPSVRVNLHIKDTDGSPTMASLLITDGVERIFNDSTNKITDAPFRMSSAQSEYRQKNYKIPLSLKGIYPLPSRRVAAYDEYPDFFFQPQVYRFDGEHVFLPPGTYDLTYTRGPEYIPQRVKLTVPSNVATHDVNLKLKRWINLSAAGWYSADHHVHAAGCSHYESPEEGVKPVDMWRQALGEDLHVAAVLTWGPSWYHQKTYFTGKDDTLSNRDNIMRHDVEVSGFPSSHAGHICLLRIKEDDYPGTTKIEDWPSWTAPVLQWAKSQGGVVGYAHSGWGLEPSTPTKKLPNYIVPKMDGIGANEYIVTVTKNLIDFYSAGDTPAPWELNMWYHTLNCGFKVRLSGETDFPCIFDERVGLARSYFKPQGPFSYDSYVEALKAGRSYVSDGRSHIIDFTVNDVEAGIKDSELNLRDGGIVRIKAKVAAALPEQADSAGRAIAQSDLTQQPYWHLERARIGTSQKVNVELIVNGQPVDSSEMNADGNWTDVNFDYKVSHSSWIALRIYPSVHTNPVFVLVDNKPVHEKKSAEWCRKAVDQCWQNKQSLIRASERDAAETAYKEAKAFYDKVIAESREE